MTSSSYLPILLSIFNISRVYSSFASSSSLIQQTTTTKAATTQKPAYPAQIATPAHTTSTKVAGGNNITDINNSSNKSGDPRLVAAALSLTIQGRRNSGVGIGVVAVASSAAAAAAAEAEAAAASRWVPLPLPPFPWFSDNP